MYFFKSPWRKWICFGVTFITILLLLDAEPTLFANDAYSSEWHWFRFVAFIGVMMIAGIGFLDLRKPNQNREANDVISNGAEESSLVEDPLKHSGKQTDEVCKTSFVAFYLQDNDSLIIHCQYSRVFYTQLLIMKFIELRLNLYYFSI